MQPHTKIYMDAFGYEKGDFIPSEISGQRAVDICHIKPRGAGGNPSKDLDRIENLMAQTREEHHNLGDKKSTTADQYRKHMEFMELNGISFDYGWTEKQIQRYEVYENDEMESYAR